MNKKFSNFFKKKFVFCQKVIFYAYLCGDKIKHIKKTKDFFVMYFVLFLVLETLKKVTAVTAGNECILKKTYL